MADHLGELSVAQLTQEYTKQKIILEEHGARMPDNGFLMKIYLEREVSEIGKRK